MAFSSSCETIFDVREWVQRFTGTPSSPSYTIHGPVSLGWTKTSPQTYKHGDNSGLSRLQLPASFPVDLNQWHGRRYIPSLPGDTAGVEIIIRELLLAAAAGQPPPPPSDTAPATSTSSINMTDFHVVSYRNNLNKILGTIIDHKQQWIIDGCFYNTTTTTSNNNSSSDQGSLFLDIVNIPTPFEGTAEGQKFIRWGRAFEAACTGQYVADSTQEYGMAIASTLGDIKLCIGAEIDCYVDNDDVQQNDMEKIKGEKMRPRSLSSLVEMKTFKPPSHPKQWQTLYKFKHPKWWVQSYLAGVDKLVLGARDDMGFITEIHELTTESLPGISHLNGFTSWSPEQLLAFGRAVLEWMLHIAAAAGNRGNHVRFIYGSGVITYEVMPEEQMGGMYLPKRLEKVLSEER